MTWDMFEKCGDTSVCSMNGRFGCHSEIGNPYGSTKFCNCCCNKPLKLPETVLI